MQSFAVLEPTADGFRNYFGAGNSQSPAELLVNRANMLTPRFTHVGTGVVQDAGGEYFVVQAYMDRTC